MMPARYKNFGIMFYRLNFFGTGTDRGGLAAVHATPRLSPCVIPFTDIYIEHNGNMVPCCNIRSDADAHQKYILGNVAHDSIIEIFFSHKAVLWRNSLAYFHDMFHTPCKNCFFASAEASKDNITMVENLMISPLYERSAPPPRPFALVRHDCSEIAGLKAEIASMRNSKSWRITAPLRYIVGNLRKIGESDGNT
jgi:radical SAM protein with 4Fe4S-binding SPASM domain